MTQIKCVLVTRDGRRSAVVSLHRKFCLQLVKGTAGSELRGLFQGAVLVRHDVVTGDFLAAGTLPSANSWVPFFPPLSFHRH